MDKTSKTTNKMYWFLTNVIKNFYNLFDGDKISQNFQMVFLNSTLIVIMKSLSHTMLIWEYISGLMGVKYFRQLYLNARR